MRLRKLALIFLSLFVLSACKAEAIDFEGALKDSLSRPLAVSTNHNKPYFKYYLPPSVGVKVSTQLGSLLELDGIKIMMNLKVSQVVINQYEEVKEPIDRKEDDRLVFSGDGTYIDKSDDDWKYQMNVYELNENKYAVILENDYVELVSLASQENYDFLLEHMMSILRSVEVEEEKIFLAYSNKEIIEDKTIHEDFFEHAVPEDGSLIDMYNQMHPDDKIEE